jgi:uncharacterized protein YpmB
MTNSRYRWLFITIIILVILFISALIYGIFLYMDLNEERTKGYRDTERELLQQTSLAEVENIDNFNGEEPYHVVYGMDESGEEKIIFYPLRGQEKTLTTISAGEILPARDMISMWQTECGTCSLVRITPALLDDERLWELVYYDEQDRYVFDYRSIYDGSRYEAIRYRSTFK